MKEADEVLPHPLLENFVHIMEKLGFRKEALGTSALVLICPNSLTSFGQGGCGWYRCERYGHHSNTPRGSRCGGSFTLDTWKMRAISRRGRSTISVDLLRSMDRDPKRQQRRRQLQLEMEEEGQK